MSRFATPNRTRPKVLAKSPPKPTLREPGYRYAGGTPVKGASIKGRHYNEVQSDGQRKRSPLTPRSPSPNSRTGSRDDITIESSVPPSTRKSFEKPKRNERSQRKDPLPNTVSRTISPLRVSRDGFSVNAEVVSIGSESFSRSQRSRPKSASSILSRNNGYGSSDNQSVSGNSVLSTRSTLSKTSAGATISAVSTGSLYHPLSQSSPPSHGIHNIQLTQKAFRSVRKACVRDAISQFLESEEEHQNTIHTKQYIQSIHRSLSVDSYELNPQNPPSYDTQMLKKQQRIIKMTESLRKSIQDELQSYPPKLEQQIQDIFFPSENMHDPKVVNLRTEIALILLDWKKNYLKETIQSLDKHYLKWETTKEKLMNLYHSYYNEHLPLFQLILQEKQEKHEELLQLKDYIEKHRLLPQNDLNKLLQSFPSHWFEENLLKEDIIENIYNIDIHDFKQYGHLNDLQKDLLHEAEYDDSQMMYGGGAISGIIDGNSLSPTSYHQQRNEIDDFVNNSVFLSPHLLQVSKTNEPKVSILGNDDSYYDNNYTDKHNPPQQQKNYKDNQDNYRSSNNNGRHESNDDNNGNNAAIPSNILAHSSYLPFMDDPNAFNPSYSNNQQMEEMKMSNLPSNRQPVAPKTPYQVSELNPALLAQTTSPPNNNVMKVNFNVIRVLGSENANTPYQRANENLDYSPLSLPYPTPQGTPQQPPAVMNPPSSQLPSSYIPTPSSLQYSASGFFGPSSPDKASRLRDISPLTQQFASSNLEDETVTSSTNASSYISAGSSTQMQQQQEKQKEVLKKKSLQAKLLKKYSPKRDSIHIPGEEK